MHKYQGMGTVPLHLQLSGTEVETETEAETGAADVKMMGTGTGVMGGVMEKVRVGAGMGQGRPPQ